MKCSNKLCKCALTPVINPTHVYKSRKKKELEVNCAYITCFIVKKTLRQLHNIVGNNSKMWNNLNTVTKQNNIQEEIKGMINLRDAHYHSVLDLSSHVLRDVTIK
jgi:hypothetical protein